MRTALAAFQDCVAFCDAHGHGRVALPNRLMIGHCMIYLQRLSEAVPLVEETRDVAVRAGNPHTEMFATQSLGAMMAQSGQTDAAIALYREALEQDADSFDAHYGIARALDLTEHLGGRGGMAD